MDTESVTFWLTRLKDSNQTEAADQLWKRYVQRLLHLARKKLGTIPKASADEEDVAVTAFAAFLDGVQEKRFATLNDRNDLWQVLIMLTERKAFHQKRKEFALKRGGKQTFEELVTDLPCPDPAPEVAAELAEEFNRRLNELPDDLDRQIALKRLQGYSNSEIANSFGIALRTVERKVSLIRRIWTD